MKSIANIVDEVETELAFKFGIVGAAFIALICLCGCETGTPARKHAEEQGFIATEQAKRNQDAIYAKTSAANLVNFTKKKDLELKIDLQSLETQSKLNAVQWTPQAIAAETVRLQSLHDTSIVAYKERIKANDDLLAKNEAINWGAARQIRAALNPPKSTNPLVDQTGVIEATGATPQPPPLIQP